MCGACILAHMQQLFSPWKLCIYFLTAYLTYTKCVFFNKTHFFKELIITVFSFWAVMFGFSWRFGQLVASVGLILLKKSIKPPKEIEKKRITSTLVTFLTWGENAARLSLCQWNPCQLHGDTSKINDVHSVNLMDIMSGGLWMAAGRDRFVFLSRAACWWLQRGWKACLSWSTLLSRAEVGQQKPLVGELEQCCSLSQTHAETLRRGKKKVGEENPPRKWKDN